MDNKERFIEIFTSQIHRPGAAELLEWLESTDFFEAPASTHYHGSYPGGLVEHTRHAGAARAGGCEKPIRREHDLEKEFPRRAHHHSGREQRHRPCQPPY